MNVMGDHERAAEIQGLIPSEERKLKMYENEMSEINKEI
jgi:hypothetical protein